MDRHHALRSRAVRRDGRFVVEVLAQVPVDLQVDDLTGHADDEAVERWCRDQATRPFSMDRAPLFRFRLARLGPDRWVLVTVFHHAVCDGWSMGVVWRELGELHNARHQNTASQLPPVSVQFTDVARAEHQLSDDRRADLERFWRTELDGVPLRPPLPYDRPRPAKLSGQGALHTWVIDGDIPKRVAEVAVRLGTTPYVVLAATFATWVAALCGGPPDVVLAASSANRARRERSDVVGLLGDAVLLRARPGEADSFADLVTRLGTTLFTALDHQELPLTEVVELVAPGTGDSLFPTVLFTVVTTPPPHLDMRSLSASVRDLPTSDVARNELYAVLAPGADTITVTFEYSTDLFDEPTIMSWADDLTRLLQRFTRAPDSSLRASDRS